MSLSTDNNVIFFTVNIEKFILHTLFTCNIYTIVYLSIQMMWPFLCLKLRDCPRCSVQDPLVMHQGAASANPRKPFTSTTCGSSPTTLSPPKRTRQGHPRVKVTARRSPSTAVTVGSFLSWLSLTSCGSCTASWRL